jgi:hypothetical protein
VQEQQNQGVELPEVGALNFSVVCYNYSGIQKKGFGYALVFRYLGRFGGPLGLFRDFVN